MATELQQQVWDKLRDIPEGKVVTYAELARAIKKPKAVRAVASAVGKNPQLVTVPCHRVIRSDGSVGQYAGGVKKKIALLQQEGIVVTQGKVSRSSVHIFDK